MAVGSNYFLLLTVPAGDPEGLVIGADRTAAAVRACVNATRLLTAYCLLPAAYCRVAAIEGFGCVLVRHGAKHDWYANPNTGVSQPVPRHREIKDRLAKHIIKMLRND